MTVTITLEFTPNPNTLKYVVNRRLLLIGTENFTSEKEAKEYSPLATRIFAIPSICGVMIGSDFIAVTIDNEEQIRECNKQIMGAIKEHLESGEIICYPRDEEDVPQEENELSLRIRKVIEQEVRPVVAMDGGDIIFSHFKDGTVFLNLVGACSGCPSSTITLKMGIQRRLQEEFPEVEDVVSIP